MAATHLDSEIAVVQKCRSTECIGEGGHSPQRRDAVATCGGSRKNKCSKGAVSAFISFWRDSLRAFSALRLVCARFAGLSSRSLLTAARLPSKAKAGGGAGNSGWDALYLNFDLKNTAFAQLRLIETAPLLSFIRARMPKNAKNLLTSTA